MIVSTREMIEDEYKMQCSLSTVPSHLNPRFGEFGGALGHTAELYGRVRLYDCSTPTLQKQPAV
jgi:hypothetical protein